MRFDFSVYSSILLIFFTQGLLFSVLLLKKGITTASKSNIWLSAFVFLCSLYLLPWMLGFAGWYTELPYRDIMFYVPFQQLFLIGPCIYFYTSSLLNPAFRFTKREFIHLIPALLYFLYRIIVFVTDQIIFREYVFYSGGRDLSLDNWYQLAGFSSMVIYFVQSLKYYAVYKRVIDLTISFTDRLRFGWVRKCLWAFLAMQLLWLVFFVMYPNWGHFTAKWWYFIGFSSIMYYIGFSGYINNEISLIPFRISGPDKLSLSLTDLLPRNDNTTVSVKEDPDPTPSDAIRNPNIEDWKQKIESVIVTGALYKNAGLTLQMVAEQLGTNQTIISKMINQGFGMSFNDLINQYRTNAVIGLLEKHEYKHQTLLGISIDCGFNSKTTFNRCFKKYTGFTPTDYISKLEKGNFQK